MLVLGLTRDEARHALLHYEEGRAFRRLGKDRQEVGVAAEPQGRAPALEGQRVRGDGVDQGGLLRLARFARSRSRRKRQAE